MSREIKLTATKPQAAFHALTCRYALFVAGYGSGKTEAMLNQALIDASIGSNALIGLYTLSYDLLNLNIAPRLEVKLTALNIPHKYSKKEKIMYVEHPQFCSFILRSLDRPERLVGYETYRSHIDELDVLPTNKAKEAFNKIIARNRQIPIGYTKDKIQNRVSVYTTPEGFKFCYDRWGDVDADGISRQNKEYQRIQAPSYSNPYLPNDYIESLKATYPEELVKAYIEGEFVNLTSGTIYKNYDRIKHRSTETIKAKETLYIGMDFNVNNMSATIFVRRDGGRIWHAVDEICGELDTPAMIKTIKERYAKHHIVVYPDATGKNREANDASVSDISLLKTANFEVRAHKSNPFVKDRIMAVNKAFSDMKLLINDTLCPRTALCLEQQIYNENGDPDKKSGKDHQNDATGYPIAYEMPVKKPVFNIEVTFN